MSGIMKEALPVGEADKGNLALDLMTFLLTKEIGSEEEVRTMIRESGSVYTNETVAAFALCASRGIDVLGALDQIQERLRKEGLLAEIPGTVGPEQQEMPYVWTEEEFDNYIAKKLPEWKEALKVPTGK